MSVQLALILSAVLLSIFPVSAAVLQRPRHETLPSTPLLPHSLRISQLDVATHPLDLVIDTPTPHFSWQLTDEAVRGLTQTAYQLRVLTQLPDGSLHLPPNADTGRVASSQSTHITHPTLTLTPNTRYVLRVRYWSSTGGESGWGEAGFRTSMMGEWRDAPGQWIGSRLIPMNEVRKQFTLSSTPSPHITAATLQMSGIGYSTLYINGRAVDPSRRLDPGWTTFQKRTLYVNFAVEGFLTGGENVIAVELGNGWFSQEQYVIGQQEPTYGPPRLWLWLHAVYSDNSTVDVSSDTTWMGSTGPTLHDGVYSGSVVDHRWARPMWTSANFSDPTSVWLNASVLPSPSTLMECCPCKSTTPSASHQTTSMSRRSAHRVIHQEW